MIEEITSNIFFQIFSVSLFAYSIVVLVRAVIFSYRLAHKIREPIVKNPKSPPQVKQTDIDMEAIIRKNTIDPIDDPDPK